MRTTILSTVVLNQFIHIDWQKFDKEKAPLLKVHCNAIYTGSASVRPERVSEKEVCRFLRSRWTVSKIFQSARRCGYNTRNRMMKVMPGKLYGDMKNYDLICWIRNCTFLTFGK